MEVQQTIPKCFSSSPCLQLLKATRGVWILTTAYLFLDVFPMYISQLVWKKYLIEFQLYHCVFLPLKVWLVVGCVAAVSHLSPCGHQLKLSLPWAPWHQVVSLPEVFLLSRHLLQEEGAGSSLQALPMVEPTYQGEAPLGEGGPPWAEDSLRHQHPPGVNFHSRQGGECLKGKMGRNVERFLF